jgi:hypothetical protein
MSHNHGPIQPVTGIVLPFTVYKNNLHTIKELREEMLAEVNSIREETLAEISSCRWSQMLIVHILKVFTSLLISKYY